MSNNHYVDTSRRVFIKLGVVGLAAAPLGSLLTSEIAQAAMAQQRSSTTIPRLDEDDSQAVVLSYRENATLVDTSKYKRDGQFCHNCQLYSGQPDQEWGPCTVFSYRVDPKTNSSLVVNANGWCRAWGPRAG